MGDGRAVTESLVADEGSRRTLTSDRLQTRDRGVRHQATQVYPGHREGDVPSPPSGAITAAPPSRDDDRDQRLHGAKGRTRPGERVGDQARPRAVGGAGEVHGREIPREGDRFPRQDFELVLICLGLPPAARMVHLMLSTLLHRFEWRLPPDVERNGVDMSENFGVTLGMSMPLQAIAKPI